MARTTSVKYTCECGKSFRVAPDKIGSGMKCPRCQRPIGEGGGGEEEEERPAKDESGGHRRTKTRRTTTSRHRPAEPPAEPEQDDAVAEELPAAAPSATNRTRRGGAAREPAPERARRGHRTVEGYGTLEKVASFASLFGILLFVACDIVATYFIIKGPAAPMAASAKQAQMYAVMFGVLGLIAFVFLFVVGQFSRVLLGLVDVTGDLRSRLQSHLADED